MTTRQLLWCVLAAGVAGLLDIVFACTFWALKAGVPVRRILQSVAAGLLGKASFDGGRPAAALGLTLHFSIALVMSWAYFMVASRWPALTQRPWLFGALYGLVLYVVMTFIVVPLSAAMPSSKDAAWVAFSVVAHVVLVGLPIALFARHALQ